MYKQILTLTISLLLVSGCQSSQKQVETQAEKFLTAYYGENFQEAKTLSTYTTQKLIDEKEYYQSLNPYIKEDGIPKFRILKVLMRAENTQAQVEYWLDGKSRNLFLVNENNTWLVNMDKENPIENAMSLTNKQIDGGGVSSAQSAPVKIADVK